MMKRKRCKLTKEEFNLVAKLLSVTKLDDTFDIETDYENEDLDYFFDYTNIQGLSLEEGFNTIAGMITNSFVDYEFTKEESDMLINLFTEFVNN